MPTKTKAKRKVPKIFDETCRPIDVAWMLDCFAVRLVNIMNGQAESQLPEAAKKYLYNLACDMTSEFLDMTPPIPRDEWPVNFEQFYSVITGEKSKPNPGIH